MLGRAEQLSFCTFLACASTLVMGQAAYSLFTDINKHFIEYGDIVLPLVCLGGLIGVLIDSRLERRAVRTSKRQRNVH